MKSGGVIQYTQHYPSTSSGQAPSTSSGQAPSAALRAGSSGIEYRQGAAGAPVIEAIYHPEGRVYNTNVMTIHPSVVWRYEYSIRDHLGNTRITFSDLNGNNKVDVLSSATTNEVLQENHYYPGVYPERSRRGLGTNGAWMNNAALDNLYQYNGKELNADWGLNMLDYGARMYMADVGRWGGVDALASDYAGWSPYNYVMGNPLRLVDPDGRTVVAGDEAARAVITNGLKKKHEKYVQFNEKGQLNAELLSKAKGKSGNLEALKQLASSEMVYSVEVSDSYKTLDENGKEVTKSFSDDGKVTQSELGITTGGTAGTTLFPNAKETDAQSPDGQVHVVVNAALNSEQRTVNFSHEAYGHAYLYDIGLNPYHTFEPVEGSNGSIQGYKKSNTPLESQIVKRRKETIKNIRKN